jgi:hypothetical protein
MSSEHRIDAETAALGNALRALAPLTPPVDGWPRLRASLPLQTATSPGHRPRRYRQGQRWLALAAALAFCTVLVSRHDRWWPDDGGATTAATQARAAPVTGNSDALAEESARLEALLAWIAPGGRSAEALAIDLALIDRMQWVDHLLASPATDAATREVLWRERVALLSRRLLLSEHESLAISGDHAALAATL